MIVWGSLALVHISQKDLVREGLENSIRTKPKPNPNPNSNPNSKSYPQKKDKKK